MSKRRSKRYGHPPTVRGVFEEAECDAVAPKMKLYYCEHCKEYVIPLNAHVTMELIVSIPSMKVTETETATHIKCGSILRERFWKE
jgi:hypothetical protein